MVEITALDCGLMVQIGRVKIRTFAAQRAFERSHGPLAGRKQWVQSLADTGLHSGPAAVAVGISRCTLLRAARTFEITFARTDRSPKKITDEQMRQASLENLTVRQVCEKHNVSDFTVRARAVALGLKLKRVRNVLSGVQGAGAMDLVAARKTMSGPELMAEFARRENQSVKAHWSVGEW